MFKVATYYDEGLGLVVTILPSQVPVREKYWLKVIVDDYAQQYRDAGYVDGLPEHDGLGWGFKSFFGGGGGGQEEAPKIPWEEIYALARPLARQYAEQEEQSRRAEEAERIRQEKLYDIALRSRAAAEFKMPEGMIGARKNVLIHRPKGQPTEVRK